MGFADLPAMLLDVPGDGERRCACPGCWKRYANGEVSSIPGMGPDKLWQFCRVEAKDTAKADWFELRGRGDLLEYRVTSHAPDDREELNPPDWRLYPWDAVLCVGCAYDEGMFRVFDPRTGRELEATRG